MPHIHTPAHSPTEHSTGTRSWRADPFVYSTRNFFLRALPLLVCNIWNVNCTECRPFLLLAAPRSALRTLGLVSHPARWCRACRLACARISTRLAGRVAFRFCRPEGGGRHLEPFRSLAEAHGGFGVAQAGHRPCETGSHARGALLRGPSPRRGRVSPGDAGHKRCVAWRHRVGYLALGTGTESLGFCARDEVRDTLKHRHFKAHHVRAPSSVSNGWWSRRVARRTERTSMVL